MQVLPKSYAVYAAGGKIVLLTGKEAASIVHSFHTDVRISVNCDLVNTELFFCDFFRSQCSPKF